MNVQFEGLAQLLFSHTKASNLRPDLQFIAI